MKDRQKWVADEEKPSSLLKEGEKRERHEGCMVYLAQFVMSQVKKLIFFNDNEAEEVKEGY